MKNIYASLILLVSVLMLYSCTTDESSDNSSTESGSYSTMLVIQNRLYLVNLTQIKTFDLTTPESPVLLQESDLGFDIESLFSYNGLLLVGSRSGMHILELDEEGIPQKRSYSDYNNTAICSKDPIVARDNNSYVTISSDDNVWCNGFRLDELRIYNITNPALPVLLETIEMSKPKGLGLGKSKLYICDEVDGLVVFDLTNPQMPVREKSFGGFKAFDLIVKGNLLFVSCDDQLRQYDITDEENTFLVSVINI